jgi:hypothetical protein
MHGTRNASVRSVDDYKEDYKRWRPGCKTDLIIINWDEMGGMLASAAGWRELRDNRAHGNACYS